MFLHLLNKDENDSFIELFGIVKKMNRQIAKSECDHKGDLKPDRLLPFDNSQHQLQSEIIGRLKNSSIQAKRTILLELASLLYREKIMTEDLLQWFKLLGEEMGVNEHQVEKLLEWSNDFNEFIEIGYMYINSK